MQVNGGASDLAIKLAVNGAAQAITVDVRTSLLDLLREHFHLTGPRRAATMAPVALALSSSTNDGCSPA